MIEAVDEIAFKQNDPTVTVEIIDEAFRRVLKERKNFEDWLERLKDYQADHFSFINEILKNAAHKGSVSVQVIYDMAQKHDRADDYMDFVDELIYDGYLAEFETHVYRFS